MDNVTFICTACGRPDLLARTLASFMSDNTYPVSDMIVYEDSGEPDINYDVKRAFPKVRFIEPKERRGQIVAQDALWRQVKTPYVLQWEEDWETYQGGFVEKSLPILKENPRILQVLFRHPSDVNGHPTFSASSYYKHSIDFRVLSTSYTWKGFSFAPSLKRLADYEKLGSYGKHVIFDRKKPAKSEFDLGLKYFKMGYIAAILKDGYVRHIGVNRHVK
jgi:hypothetical protein